MDKMRQIFDLERNYFISSNFECNLLYKYAIAIVFAIKPVIS